MAKMVLNVEYDYDFTLIGIACHEKEYRLCWTLNNALAIELERVNDLTIELKKQKAPLQHGLFTYINDDLFREYYLITNKGANGFLIPEQSKADFLLMIKGTLPADEKTDIITKIKSLPNVLLCFDIQPNTLKSKENLVF